MNEKLDDKLLEMKRKKFREVVLRICNARQLLTPIINFEGCPEESEDEEAHYHPDFNMICISKKQMANLNLDEIENAATHEVTHILELNHDDNFYREERMNKTSGWKAYNAGVVIIETDEEKRLKT